MHTQNVVATKATCMQPHSIALIQWPMQLFVLTIAICLALSAAKCPLGYVQGVRDDDCLKYFTDELSWDDAEDECRSAGGHLASSVSAFANSFLATLQSCGAEYWLGASKGELSNDWSWADGNSFNYKNWAKGTSKLSRGSIYFSLKVSLKAVALRRS